MTDLSKAALANIIVVAEIVKNMGADQDHTESIPELMLDEEVGSKHLLRYLEKAEELTASMNEWIE